MIKWTAGLAIIVAVALAIYFYHRIDDEVRLAVETRLAHHYPRLKVAVREAQLVQGDGIRVRGLSISEPGRGGPDEQLLFVDELFIHCSTDPRDLLNGKLVNARFSLRKPVLRTTRKPDGTWSAAKLLPMPKLGDAAPAGSVEGGVVEIIDLLEASPTRIVLRDAAAKWSAADEGVRLNGRRPLRFQGQLAADHVRKIALDALVDVNGGAWTLAGAVEGLEVCPELRAALPSSIAGACAKLGPLRAKAEARFQCAYQAAADGSQAAALTYDVEGTLAQGRIEDERLPYPVTDLTAKFRLNAAGFGVTELSARHGPAVLKGQMERAGLAADSPTQLRATAQRLMLDAKIADLLPEQWRKQWHNFLPAGEVDLDLALTYDGAVWRPEMTMNCVNVSFTYHKFPYRLERGRGKISISNGRLVADLAALSNSEEVKILSELVLDGTRTHGWTDLRGDGLRIDERLLRAMPDAMQPLAVALHPQGRFNLTMRVWKDAPGDGPMHKHAVVMFRDASLRYDKFPYPLAEVNGTVEMIDDRWIFHDDLRAVNDGGRITCRGELTPSPAGSELALFFHGDNVPIDDELRDALNPGARRLWTDMKPRGTIHLDTEVRYSLAEKRLGVWVRAQPVGETVSIEPSYFPYRFEKLTGDFTFSDGRLGIERLRAEHGRTQVSATGECTIDPSGGWRLTLQHLFVDRLAADRDLLNALPEGLKKAVGMLEPVGSFNVRGMLTLAGGGEPGRPMSSDWNVTLDCQNNALQCGIELHAIHGSVSLTGRSEGGRFESSGELQLDSISYLDHQCTEVLGPIWLDNRQVLLGFWADRRRGQLPERHLTGKLYGGSTVADGWIMLGDEPEYAFLAKLAQGSLAQFAQEHMPGTNRLSGEILAAVDLRGKGKTRNNLMGRGNVQLRNADIYQLDAMVSLLKVLSLRAPDSTAFTQSDINFVIQGEHVYLERIDLSGHAISLQGRGELNLVNDQVNLVFRTVVGSDASRLPAVKQLLGGASQQILLLHVDGPLANPHIRREAFPGVNQVLEQLQAELQRPVSPAWQNGTTRLQPPEKLQ